MPDLYVCVCVSGRLRNHRSLRRCACAFINLRTALSLCCLHRASSFRPAVHSLARPLFRLFLFFSCSPHLATHLFPSPHLLSLVVSLSEIFILLGRRPSLHRHRFRHSSSATSFFFPSFCRRRPQLYLPSNHTDTRTFGFHHCAQSSIFSRSVHTHTYSWSDLLRVLRLLL